MPIMDYNKDDDSLRYCVNVGTVIQVGNDKFFVPDYKVDTVFSSRGGRDAVKRAARHFCQSMGVLEYRKMRISGKSATVWRVTGTTGKEMWFRVRRNER